VQNFSAVSASNYDRLRKSLGKLQALAGEDFSAFVPDVHFEQIAIKNLVSNQDYQRNLSYQHIQRMVANFDLRQINPVKVSRRDGQNIVMNGQHTIESVVMASGSRDTPVWCMVYDDLDYQEEADIFANQQKYVKVLRPYEIFMANIEAGNDAQLMIKTIVESYGLLLLPSRGPGGICAIATLEYINFKYGCHVLDRMLRLCVAAWEGDPLSLGANMLKGIARLVAAFGDNLKDDGFRDRVGSLSPRDIIRTARERRVGSLGYAEVMVMEYNKRRKDGLHMSKLSRAQEMEEVDGAENAAL